MRLDKKSQWNILRIAGKQVKIREYIHIHTYIDMYIYIWKHVYESDANKNDYNQHAITITVCVQIQLFDTLTYLSRDTMHDRHLADDIFKCISLNENEWISIEIPLEFLPKGPINNSPALVQIMAWRRPGDKPLFEPMMSQYNGTYMRG